MDWMSLVPGSTIEELLHDNAADAGRALMKGLAHIPHDPAVERPCITLMSAGDGDQAQMVAVIGTTNLDGTPRRDITWFSVVDLLRTVPIADWMRKSKQLGKEAERLQKQVDKLQGRAGREAELMKLQQEMAALQERMKDAFAWPGVTDAPAFTNPPPALAPAAPELPAHDDRTPDTDPAAGTTA